MKIAILFAEQPVKGRICARNGDLKGLHGPADSMIAGTSFDLPRGGRIEAAFENVNCRPGAFPTIVTVETGTNPFSFNLRDVCPETPIWIPEFGVAVTPAEDSRGYPEIVADIAARRLVCDFTRFELEPEESYAGAARRNRSQYCPTWLGLGRDMRIFRIGYQERYNYWGEVQPAFHTRVQSLPECGNRTYKLFFAVGHGASCRPRIIRRIEDGVLPILCSDQIEEDMRYRLTSFATLETRTLHADQLRGSDWQASYANTGGNMLSEKERESMSALLADEMREREEEVVCCVRVEAINTGRVPRYAWFHAAQVHYTQSLPTGHTHQAPGFDKGYSTLEKADKVFAVNRVDGQAMPDAEMAVLVQPGRSVTFEMLLPHSPVSAERAQALMNLDFDAHLDACRAYWRARLESAAEIRLPEPEIDQSVRAGLLHCDLAALGREPDGPVLATIGAYSPIGTESAPIIQYFDSMGWHRLAERALQFFFERQRPDGFIQNFARYESETGPLLWTAGEHFRYTRDKDWLRRIAPNVKKAADYLLQWRERNKTEEQRAKGCYGMVDGKVADPDDFYHSFFLNAGTYIGLKRSQEMLREIDPDYARMLAAEVTAYREDIRAGFYHAQARSPVMPLGDGSWAPLMPPWVEHTGGISFYADGGRWFSHGAFASRSCLTGPLWLIIGEVLDPREIGAEFMIKTNQYPITLDNAALSQPYYCRHDFAHIRRGEVNALLKTYYNQITALQDRETHTFWEHYYHASQHKTHEEAWFLMQTRWMLWLEDGPDLRLLEAIPRRWLENGREIGLRDVKSYFGALSLRVRSELQLGRIVAEGEIETRTPPRGIRLRLPHPDKLRARRCEGGTYVPEEESVVLPPDVREWRVVLSF